MTARILFLDDQPRRADIFKTKYPDAVWVTTSAQAIECLSVGAWDMVCLDYDLLDGDDGMVVARWMAAHCLQVERVVVHSTNLLRAVEMVTTLRMLGAVYVPFSYLQGGPFNL
jgi:DNA-binding response OmpR family regulator